ncbi:MAG: hypothetical protein PHQ28_06935 [Mycobacterium sp.]|nr:hypothetical protein [Mycobacterium sp.]
MRRRRARVSLRPRQLLDAAITVMARPVSTFHGRLAPEVADAGGRRRWAAGSADQGTRNRRRLQPGLSIARSGAAHPMLNALVADDRRADYAYLLE